jgi:hypothetical protein
LKAIRQRACFLAVFAGLGATACVLIVFYIGTYKILTPILLGIVLFTSMIAAVLCIRETIKLKTARLIVENQILHIRPAVIINAACARSESGNPNGIDIFISYFGILLDSRIIKFNQDGIRLMSVEMGHDYISFMYGTEKWAQNMRLLRTAVDPSQLDQIVEKFRYETGIIPKFTY